MEDDELLKEIGDSINEERRLFLNKAEEDFLIRNFEIEKVSISIKKEPIPWSVLFNKKYIESRWRIKNLIPMEGMVILASVSGEKKTWIALEMARCISEGKDFLGQQCFVTEGAKVLYVDGENSQKEITRRGKQIGLDPECEKLFFHPVDDLNLGNDEGAQDFIENIVIKEGYEVVFIDTLRAIAGALKEDKAEDVREFFNRFKKLKDLGIVVIFLDHLRKPSNLDGKLPKKEHLLGSQDKSASIEVLLMMKSDSGTNEINVYQRKNRLDKEINPFQIIMEDSDEDDDKKTVFSYGGEIDSDDTKKEEAKELIYDILSDEHKRTTKEILDILKKKIGQKNTRNALKELVEEGMLEQEKMGKQNLYGIAQKYKQTMEISLLDAL